MTLPPRAPLPSLIPEGAPFSAEQRVWLNGLFAGLLSLEGGITALSPEQAAVLLPGSLDLAAPATVERMLKAYLAHRASPQETFQQFTRRHEVEALRALIDVEAAE